jgi:hypothetical protein
MKTSVKLPSCLVEIDRRFRGTYCIHHQGNEAACKKSAGCIGIGRIIETSRLFQRDYTALYIYEGFYLHTRCSENLRYHV